MEDALSVTLTSPLQQSIGRKWLRFVVERKNERHDVTCADNVSVETESNLGVILDILSGMNIDHDAGNSVMEIADAVHSAEKNLFMELVTENLLAQYEVSYHDVP